LSGPYQVSSGGFWAWYFSRLNFWMSLDFIMSLVYWILKI